METLLHILDRRAREEGQRLALAYLASGDTITDELTYHSLRSKALQVARILMERCNVGDRAVLLFPPGLDFIVAFLGCLYAGVIAVPAYPPRSRKPDFRIAAILQDAMPSVLLTVSSVRDRLDNTEVPVINIDGLSVDDASEMEFPERSDVAWLQYTSGTTTDPRGVVITHDNLMHNAECLKQAAQYSHQTVAVTWLPHFHDMGLVEALLQPIIHGFPAYFFPATVFLQHPIKWLRLMSRYQATHSGAPNFAYDLCARMAREEDIPDLDLSRWSTAYIGAEPVYRTTLETFHVRFRPCGFRWEAFYPGYGMAETTLEISGGIKGQGPRFVFVNKADLSAHRVKLLSQAGDAAFTLVSSGFPLQDFVVRVVHPIHRGPCADDEIGEIWLAGKSIARGYWCREVETRDTFEASTGEGPYLRTGDLGFLLNGEIFIAGRLKDVMIIRGRNYYPADAEHVISTRLSGIMMSAVFQVDLVEDGRVVLLLEIDRHVLRDFRTNRSTVGSFEVMAKKAHQVLAEELHLSLDEVMIAPPGTIPKTSSGKVQRHICKARFQAGQIKGLWQWSRSTPQPTIASVEG